MKKTLLGALLGASVLLSGSARAGTPGSAGANFLEFGQGPRAVGMGESQVAVAEDAYAAYWNPAGLAAMEYANVALTYNKALEDVDEQYFSLAYPLQRGSTLNLNFTRLGMTSFTGYDATGLKTGDVDASDYALGVAYGRTVLEDELTRPRLNLGLGVKGVQETLGDVTARTYAFDAGALYYLHWGQLRGDAGRQDAGLRLGAAARNLGPGLKFDSVSSPLPATYQTGAAWRTYPWGDALTLSCDQVWSKDQAFYTGFGAEFTVYRLLSFRVGYRTGQDIGNGIRAGVGFKLKIFDLDYAYAGFGDLGQMHRVGLSARLGGPVDTTAPEERTLQAVLDRGARLMQEGRYYEAVIEFDQALQIDPGNRKALEMMRRANEKLQK